MNLSVESKAFQQILHNLRLENMSLSAELQEVVVSLVNRNVTITPELIKGILQEYEGQSVATEILSNPELNRMIDESREEIKLGLGMTTSDLLDSLSSKDFR